MSLSMNALNWIGAKIGVDIVDTTQDEQQQSSAHPYGGQYPGEQRAIPSEQNPSGVTSSPFESFPQSTSFPSHYRDSMSGIDRGSVSAFPVAGQSTPHTPSVSPLQRSAASMNEGLRTSSMPYQNAFQNGAVMGSQTVPPPLSSSNAYAPLQRDEDDVVGVMEPVAEPHSSSSAQQVFENLVKVDPVLLQAKAQEAKEKVFEISHVAQEKVTEYVWKASTWMGSLQDAVKKKVSRDFASAGRAFEFSEGRTVDPGVNNEVDDMGLPVSKQWYVFNHQLNRWDVSEEAPWEVRQEFYQQLEQAEAAKQRQQQLMAGGGDSGPHTLPPPPPPPPTSFGSHMDNEGGVGADHRGGGGRRVDSHRPFSMQAPQYAQPSYFSSPSSVAAVVPPPTSANLPLPASLPLSYPTTAPSASRQAPLSSSPQSFGGGFSGPNAVGTSLAFPAPPPSSSTAFPPVPSSSSSSPRHLDPASSIAPVFPLSSHTIAVPPTSFPPSPSHGRNPAPIGAGTEMERAKMGLTEAAFSIGVVPSSSTSPNTHGVPNAAVAAMANSSPTTATGPIPPSPRCHPNPLQSLPRKKATASLSSRPTFPSTVGGQTAVAIPATPPPAATTLDAIDPPFPSPVPQAPSCPLFPTPTTAAAPPLPSSSCVPPPLSQSVSSDRNVEEALRRSAMGRTESATVEERGESAVLPSDSCMHPSPSPHRRRSGDDPLRLASIGNDEEEAKGLPHASEEGSLQTAWQGRDGLPLPGTSRLSQPSLHNSGIIDHAFPPPPSLSGVPEKTTFRMSNATTPIAPLSSTLLDSTAHRGGRGAEANASGPTTPIARDTSSVVAAHPPVVSGSSPSWAALPPPLPTAVKASTTSLRTPQSPQKNTPTPAAVTSSLSFSSTTSQKMENRKELASGEVGGGATPNNASLRGSASSMSSVSAAPGASDSCHTSQKRVKAIPPPPSFTPFVLDS